MARRLERLAAVSVTDRLRETQGGLWRYIGRGAWRCNDERRRVVRRSNCLCDDDCSCGTSLWLYEDGKTPIRVGS